jgi:hypothetical protein
MGKNTIVVVALLLLLSACQAGPTATPVPPSPTPTAQAAESQQYDITEKDSGKTFTYSVTSRFSVILDETKYPEANLRLSCEPNDVLGSISNLPSVFPPLYAVRYEGVTPGKCMITNGSFSVTIVIVDLGR